MIIGMDFGTTNTGAAVYDGQEIQLVPLDPPSPTPHICRTSIYITRSSDYYLGSTALNLYFNQNVGRPTRYRKVKVGEIMQIFSGLPVFYRDVFVYEDEFSPGRIFLAIKTALRSQDYYGTVFLDHWYSATDLAAIFLLGMRMRMDRHFARPVKEIVLGRPVRFSNNPDEDKIAESRLVDAAFKAGFEKVYLEYEPVAAALSYERSVRDKEIVLVFDFGGGTLDFTVMEVGDPRERRVLATGGIPVAGDIFDQRLFRATIPRHLGENDYFISGGSRYPIPAHIFDLLSSPQEVLSLNTPQNLEMLRSIHLGSVHKDKTNALLKIISSNYALLMFDLIEQAKRELSAQTESNFSFTTPDFSLEERITRLRFETAIAREVEAVREGLAAVLDRAGMRSKDIHRVIRTGGSSQIPLFARLLNDMFGAQKVQAIDIFSSVTSGLAIRGHEIERGISSLEVHLPGSASHAEELAPGKANKHGVAQIELSIVKQRLEVDQNFRSGQVELPEAALVFLNQGKLQLFPSDELSGNRTKSSFPPVLTFPITAALEGPSCAVVAGKRSSLLLATNLFKLISIPIETIFLAQQVGEQGVPDLLHLDPGEVVTAMTAWSPGKLARRYLCLVTRFGQVRSFDAYLLAEQLPQRPYFQLERRYTGSPVVLIPAEEDDLLVVGTSMGRVACALRREVSVAVHDVIKARRGEEVYAATTYKTGEILLALSATGTLLSFSPCEPAMNIPPAARGQTLRRSFPIVGLFPSQQIEPGPVYALTSSGRLLPLPARINSETWTAGTSQNPWQLKTEERILSLLQGIA